MRSRGLALRLLATAGCSRCGGNSAAAAEELLPAHPPGAVVTAPLGSVAQHLLALTERASSLPGGEQLGDVRRGMTAQLGFDPLTRDGLLSAGLDRLPAAHQARRLSPDGATAPGGAGRIRARRGATQGREDLRAARPPPRRRGG